MVCALFGLNLCRFKSSFDLTDNGEYKTDIQNISRPAPNEHYIRYSEDKVIGNTIRLSSVNRIDPSMVRLPAPRERRDINDTRDQTTNSDVTLSNLGQSSSLTEKQDRYSKNKTTKTQKKPAAFANVAIDADDFNDNSVSSPSYPSYSPPPYYDTMSVRTKNPMSITSSPVLSTFKTESVENRDSRTSTPSTLPSSWDLINEHRRNIQKIPNNNSRMGESSRSEQSQELDLLSPTDSNVRRRNENYASAQHA